MSRRAPFVVIEGLDRSGKTTQTTMLVSRLEQAGIKAKLMKFPDRTTPIGKMINSYLQSQSDLDDRAIHLLFSANRWELASEIESFLSPSKTTTTTTTTSTSSSSSQSCQPKLLLADRYSFSGIAFSASKSATTTNSLSYTWCLSPEIGLPSPDLVIFLDISPEKARERGGYGAERYEKEEMQRRVREVFGRIGEEINKEERGRAWVVLDAGRSKEEVAEDIWGLVEPLKDGVDEPLGRLWADRISSS